VGNIGSLERRSFSVIGDVTNTAARLMAVAEPGQMVVADATWAQLPASRDGTSLGPTHVKGRERPVDAWILRSVGTESSGR
jgi:adenylate cyclase